ncbi:MAG: TIGR02449 family protein [Moraxellaceae bacterium]|jgi:cell division protein ZapB|nr:TIGR02449 family protein [Moraxellaceae bacterium]MBP7229973.1 TIGR02449 family protein [Moraxellaceae bacterium]MBP8853306.1 TIGR02449 family protein [Moraxellaceae bacterium]MBP9046459.1 TIGR02449 family protein [Moraxellaceae bacterium]MBP9731586.1 TIGR02449 family protein [Moraxellaceae bacterium]
MSSPDIKTLSTRIDSLVELADRLAANNRKLLAREQALLAERDDLQKKNELAKARVEAIILRLKALEAQDQEQD